MISYTIHNIYQPNVHKQLIRTLFKTSSTVYCLLSTVYCLLSTAYCLLSTVYCLLSTVYCLLSTVYCLLSTVYCLLSTVYCLLSTVYMYLLETACAVQPEIFSLLGLSPVPEKRLIKYRPRLAPRSS